MKLTEKMLSDMEAQARKKYPSILSRGLRRSSAVSCGDSFCYATCTSMTCHGERWLGETSEEHNERVYEMVSRDPVLLLVDEVRRLNRKIEQIKKGSRP